MAPPTSRKAIAINTIDISQDLGYLDPEYLWRGRIGLLTVLITNVLYLIVLTVSCLTGNEKELRRNARYYAFWREQRQLRIAMAGVTKQPKLTWRQWSKRTWGQLKGQHKFFRCFFIRYDATLQDPSAAPTGAQKWTVLFFIIIAKMCVPEHHPYRCMHPMMDMRICCVTRFVAAAVYDPRAGRTYLQADFGFQIGVTVLNGLITALIVMPG